MLKLTHIIILSLCLNFLRAETGFYGIIDQNGKTLPDTVLLLDEDSNLVNLPYLIDKPTLISFVYFHCQGFCNKGMEGIAELINYCDLTIGTHYQVFTISIDENENPSIARNTKQSLLKNINKKEAKDNWRFFTGNNENIKKLTNATGWYFVKDQTGFIHPMTTILITPKRKVSQYFYGTFYMPVHFTMAVSDAWKELSEPPRIKTLKYCYDYNSRSDRKVRSIAFGFGILTIFAILGLFFKLSIGKR